MQQSSVPLTMVCRPLAIRGGHLAPQCHYPTWVHENIDIMYWKEHEGSCTKVRWSEIQCVKIGERKRYEQENDEKHRRGSPAHRRLYSSPSLGHIKRSVWNALSLCSAPNTTFPVKYYKKMISEMRSLSTHKGEPVHNEKKEDNIYDEEENNVCDEEKVEKQPDQQTDPTVLMLPYIESTSLLFTPNDNSTNSTTKAKLKRGQKRKRTETEEVDSDCDEIVGQDDFF